MQAGKRIGVGIFDDSGQNHSAGRCFERLGYDCHLLSYPVGGEPS